MRPWMKPGPLACHCSWSTAGVENRCHISYVRILKPTDDLRYSALSVGKSRRGLSCKINSLGYFRFSPLNTGLILVRVEGSTGTRSSLEGWRPITATGSYRLTLSHRDYFCFSHSAVPIGSHPPAIHPARQRRHKHRVIYRRHPLTHTHSYSSIF